jgi:hypothetical protein
MAKRHHKSMKGEYMKDTMGKPRMEHGIVFHEDMSAPALMPREVRDQYWPKSANENMGYVDDLFEGVQKQMHKDSSDFRKIMDPKKW